MPRNTALIVVLGTAFEAGSLISDYAYNGYMYSARIDEKAAYARINADPNMLYGGYTVKELGEGYTPAAASVFGKYMIDVPVLNQYPELPVGCEITAATAAVNYLGYSADKTVLAAEYLKSDNDFFYDGAGNLRGPDPYKYFAGNPFDWGYGCFAPVIANALNLYFERNGINCEAVEIYGLNSADTEKLIEQGVPIIVWASLDMKPFNHRDSSRWLIHGTDEVYTWIGNSHTLVLCGYDGNSYYFMDCNNKADIVPYYKSLFFSRFEEAGSQAVIVKIKD